MIFFRDSDQTGREVVLPEFPQRIVSLVPSQTELLFDLGAGNRVAGVTKFCIHPAGARSSATVIGGTKQIDHGRILALKPDLVIANKEENEPGTIAELEKEVPVWVSDVHDKRSALEMIDAVGKLIGLEESAAAMCRIIENRFARLRDIGMPKRAAYLMWKNPLMVAGGDTFINAMMRAGGFENVFEAQNRYPETNWIELKERNPEVILLSTEPFPFKQSDVESFCQLFPDKQILLADGEMFTWYGSRMLQAPDYFIRLRQSLR